MKDDWYSFEPHGRTEVTFVDVERRRVRLGARATRFFKKYVAQEPNGPELVRDALGRMPYVATRWPQWPKPAGLSADEEGITLPALMLAVGRSEGRGAHDGGVHGCRRATHAGVWQRGQRGSIFWAFIDS